MSTVYSTLAQPLIAGAVAGVGSMVIAPELPYLNLPFVNQSFSTPIAVAALTAAGALISSTVSNYAVPMVTNARYAQFTADVLPPILTGAATGLLVQYGDPSGGGQAYTAQKLAVLATASSYMSQNFRDLINSPQ